ncbi:hypothetical protein J1N35_042492 [Gossypium stocksii]|uniref:DUF4283 domain-containing protein n=1 Tax=Gossypium stocksii TaxID=47602 RepID=A0A9D3UHT2_9ROSI|nr:hypothetical protein J1N35_042492 [Gossypium stocksii]
MEASGEGAGDRSDGKDADYGSWMLAERKSRRGQRDSWANGAAKLGKDPLGTRFAPLIGGEISGGGVDEAAGGLLREKKDSHAAMGGNQRETRVLALEELSYLGKISRGAEVVIRDSAEGDSGSKALGKRPVGDGFIQKEKDLVNNLPFSNNVSIFPSARVVHSKEDIAHASGPSNAQLGNIENNLVLNNPMFEGSNESVVKLDTNFLDPKHHSAVIIKDNNMKTTHNEGVVLRIKLVVIVVDLPSFARSKKIEMGLTVVLKDRLAILNLHPRNWVYNREYKPDLIDLLETRVSGSKADSIIAKLGFDFSHRVEAVGFSGEIWIGWKDSISVDILVLMVKSGGSYEMLSNVLCQWMRLRELPGFKSSGKELKAPQLFVGRRVGMFLAPFGTSPTRPRCFLRTPGVYSAGWTLLLRSGRGLTQSCA